MSESRLGAPVEVPWWIVPLALPPLVATVAGLILSAPLWARATTVLTSLLVVAALVLIATRVSSRNMQSVWISALYAVWVFVIIVWAITVATAPACHCA